ncbi:pyruvate formate lyase family protein [Eubacteriaceae bacterium ES3]|nr:pyruvate formate lyase family protein [Eubacteriaceae bacterium ES3]
MSNIKSKLINAKPEANEPVDKVWGVGSTSMGDDLSPFERVNRYKKFVLDTEFTVDSQRALLMTEACKMNEGKPQQLIIAESYAHILKNVDIHIYPDELIIGEIAAPLKASPIYPEYSYRWIPDEINNAPWDQRADNQYYATKKVQEDLLSIADYWNNNTVEELTISRMSPEELGFSHLEGKCGYLPGMFLNAGVCHTVARYERVFEQGYGGIRKTVVDAYEAHKATGVEDEYKDNFYKSLLITVDAAIEFMNRYSKLAKDMAEKESDEKRKAELLKISENCAWVSTNPPRTFWEALQLWVFTTNFTLIEANSSMSYGRFDQYMFPFYQKDLENGVLTKDEMQELLEMTFVKCLTPTKLRDAGTTLAAAGRGMGGESLTIGGVDIYGKDATNEMSFMVLNAYAHVRIVTPWIAVRLHAKTPEDFKIKLANVLRIGTGQPKVFNDEVAIPASLLAGRTLQDSRDYNVLGCVEPDAAGREYGWHDAAYVSSIKILEMALNNGRCFGCSDACPRFGKCAGVGETLSIDTGSLRDFKSMDEIITSFDKQMEYWTGHILSMLNKLDKAHQELKPLPFLSLVMDGCIEKGLDVSAGGAIYNFTGPQGAGVGNIADSLSAIEKLVFEDKEVTGEEFVDALNKNWEGYDKLYAKVNSDKVPHYGNNDQYADKYAEMAFNTYCSHVEDKPNGHGGKFLPGMYTVSSNVPLGLFLGATPDGRKAGEPIADCLGACHNISGSHDITGPTNMLHSLAKLDHVRATNGTLMNWKLTPSSLEGENGRNNLITLLDEIVDTKVMHGQFNIIGREVLLDAQENPEEYKDLLVRVAGYSAYFTELNVHLQNDLIGRTELSL